MTRDRAEPALLADVLDQAPDLVSLSEPSGEILYLNPAGIDLIGAPDLDAVRTMRSWNFFSDVGLLVAPHVERGLSTDGAWRGVGELRRLDNGDAIPVTISAFLVERSDGRPPVVASIMRDRRRRVTQDTQLQDAIASAAYLVREQQAVSELGRLAVDAPLSSLLDAATSAAAALMGVDCASVSRLNERGDALEVLAYSGSGSPPTTFATGRRSAPGLALELDSTVVCADVTSEDRFDASGMTTRGLASAVCVPFPSPPRPGVLSVHSRTPRVYADRDLAFLDTVTGILTAAIRRIELEQELRYRSLHDPLTGLANRTLAYRRIDDGLAGAARSDTTVAVLLADLDDFKTVNDSLGHASGDAVLVALARKLEGAVRDGDTVARLGGDEFLVVCDSVVDVDDAMARAREVSDVLGDVNPAGNQPIPFSASIGVAMADASVTTPAEMVRRADLAMYQAKGTAPGTIGVFDLLGHYDADRVFRLSADLRSAIDERTIHLEYQPIHDLSTGRVIGVEALARWTHPTFGVVSPAEFVAVAERTGLIASLGEWAVATACADASAWPGDASVRVNVSAYQLHDPRFVDMVREELQRSGLHVDRLGLEITETVWVADTSRVVDTLTELHELGVSLALDDMGTGYSSIAYLDRYPMFDCFKIDGSYIAALPGKRPQAIVSAIITLAEAFEVSVIGEGVETADQLAAYRACGGRFAQGFHLSMPTSSAAIYALLTAQERPDAEAG